MIICFFNYSLRMMNWEGFEISSQLIKYPQSYYFRFITGQCDYAEIWSEEFRRRKIGRIDIFAFRLFQRGNTVKGEYS